MKQILFLCLICFLFFGCSEEKRQEYLSDEPCFCGDICEASAASLIEENALLEDQRNYFKDLFEEKKVQQELDSVKMREALNGFFECNVAATCSYYPNYVYTTFVCSELSEDELNYYIQSCVYSGQYNKFYDFVEGKGVN